LRLAAGFVLFLENVWITLENIIENLMLTWKMQMSITLLITDACVNFLAFHDTKHLKFKVQKFESHLVFRIENYTA